MKTIGRLIQHLREKRGMTQKELAEEIGCDPQTVHRWEKEMHRPRRKDLECIAKVFGIDTKSMREPWRSIEYPDPTMDADTNKARINEIYDQLSPEYRALLLSAAEKFYAVESSFLRQAERVDVDQQAKGSK